MNRRWICSDVWMDILPSFDRPQLGLKMALLSDRFDLLVDKHFDGKKEFTLWNTITISKCEEQKAKLSVRIDGNFVDFPLPDHPLPNKIRFTKLRIRNIDQSVLTFLRSNKQIWDKCGTNLVIVNVRPIWIAFIREIWPIFATSIRHLNFDNHYHLDQLCCRISPTILTDLDQLDSINSGALYPDEIAAGDDVPPNVTSAHQVLYQWLHTPTKDGQPKQLRCRYYLSPNLEWINNFKEAFLRATTSVRYNMRITVYQTMPIEPFELMNERTNERLTLRKELHYELLLKRCPIIGETDEVQQKTDENLDHLNRVVFSVFDEGPLSSPNESDEKMFSTLAGPSDQRNE